MDDVKTEITLETVQNFIKKETSKSSIFPQKCALNMRGVWGGTKRARGHKNDDACWSWADREIHSGQNQNHIYSWWDCFLSDYGERVLLDKFDSKFIFVWNGYFFNLSKNTTKRNQALLYFIFLWRIFQYYSFEGGRGTGYGVSGSTGHANYMEIHLAHLLDTQTAIGVRDDVLRLATQHSIPFIKACLKRDKKQNELRENVFSLPATPMIEKREL